MQDQSSGGEREKGPGETRERRLKKKGKRDRIPVRKGKKKGEWGESRKVHTEIWQDKFGRPIPCGGAVEDRSGKNVAVLRGGSGGERRREEGISPVGNNMWKPFPGGDGGGEKLRKGELLSTKKVNTLRGDRIQNTKKKKKQKKPTK